MVHEQALLGGRQHAVASMCHFALVLVVPTLPPFGHLAQRPSRSLTLHLSRLYLTTLTFSLPELIPATGPWNPPREQRSTIPI